MTATLKIEDIRHNKRIKKSFRELLKIYPDFHETKEGLVFDNISQKELDDTLNSLVSNVYLPEEDLNSVREQSMNNIASAVNNLKSEFLTPIVGQDDLYREKYNQALEYIENGGKIANYPLIESDSKALNITAKKAANNIIEKRSQWMEKTAQIEKIRIHYQNKIKNAGTIAQTNKHLNSFFEEINQLNL